MEKKGAKRFTEAADNFFEKVSDSLNIEVVLGDMVNIQKATALAELIYKCNQSIKLMKEDKKGKGKFDDPEVSMVDKWANKDRNGTPKN